MKVGALAKSPPITISSSEPIIAAASLMAKNRIGLLPVVDGGVLVGVVSERDIVRAIAEGRDPREPLADIMQRNIVVVDYEDDVGKAALLMRAHKIRHLVVFKEGKLYGVLSIRDLIKEREVLESVADAVEHGEELAAGD